MAKNEGSRSSRVAKVQRYADHVDALDGGRFEENGVVFRDDFSGDVLEDAWAPNFDGGCDVAILVKPGGVVELKTDNTQNNKAELTNGLNWRASDGGLIFECIVSLGAITNVEMLVGLNDQLTEAGQTLPFSDWDTPVDVATNAVMIGFSTAASTNTNFKGLTVKAGSPQAVGLTDDPVALAYNKLRIEIDSSGNADFYVDGTLRDSIANAVTATTRLTPYFGIKTVTTAIKSMGVDYVQIFKTRAYTDQSYVLAT